MAECRPPDRDRGSEDLLSDPANGDLDHDGSRRDLLDDPGVQDLTRDAGTQDSLQLGRFLGGAPPSEVLLGLPHARSGGFTAPRRLP